MTAEDNLCTVDVMLNGAVHQVAVSGNNSPAFGFESGAGYPSGPVLLRFRCDVCNGVAKLEFAPPANWRRPFVIRRVVHVAQSDG